MLIQIGLKLCSVLWYGNDSVLHIGSCVCCNQGLDERHHTQSRCSRAWILVRSQETTTTNCNSGCKKVEMQIAYFITFTGYAHQYTFAVYKKWNIFITYYKNTMHISSDREREPAWFGCVALLRWGNNCVYGNINFCKWYYQGLWVLASFKFMSFFYSKRILSHWDVSIKSHASDPSPLLGTPSLECSGKPNRMSWRRLGEKQRVLKETARETGRAHGRNSRAKGSGRLGSSEYLQNARPSASFSRVRFHVLIKRGGHF